MDIQGYLITAVITVVSIILTAIITRYYSKRRKLQVVILSVIDIVDLSRISDKKISVLYNSESIENLWVIRLIIRNTGNQDISGETIKQHPKLKFHEGVNIIGIDSAHLDDKTSVTCSVYDDNSSELVFDVEYLTRGEKGAFQILAHTENGEEMDPQKITLDKGIVQDTDLSLSNYKNSFYPLFMGKLAKTLNENPVVLKLILALYILLGIFLVLVGIGTLIDFPYLNSSILESDVQTSESLLDWLMPIIMGILLCIPAFSLLKRLKYKNLFPKKDK